MDNKAMNVSDTNRQAMEIKNLNKYLAMGNGRGRLNSAATVYDGNVGYFFVSTMAVDGVEQESIIFSCSNTDHGMTLNPDMDMVITEFPAHPKFWVKE